MFSIKMKSIANKKFAFITDFQTLTFLTHQAKYFYVHNCPVTCLTAPSFCYPCLLCDFL